MGLATLFVLSDDYKILMTVLLAFEVLSVMYRLKYI
jgi:hypothetical protein